jgi:hypothetical protein
VAGDVIGCLDETRIHSFLGQPLRPRPPGRESSTGPAAGRWRASAWPSSASARARWKRCNPPSPVLRAADRRPHDPAAQVRSEPAAPVFRSSPQARYLGDRIEEFGRAAVTAGLHSVRLMGQGTGSCEGRQPSVPAWPRRRSRRSWRSSRSSRKSSGTRTPTGHLPKACASGAGLRNQLRRYPGHPRCPRPIAPNRSRRARTAPGLAGGDPERVRRPSFPKIPWT